MKKRYRICASTKYVGTTVKEEIEGEFDSEEQMIKKEFGDDEGVAVFARELMGFDFWIEEID